MGKRGKYLSLAIIVLTMATVSCAERNRAESPIKITGKAQGSYYSIAYYDEQQRDFRESIDSLLDDFDQTASLWVEGSLLRRVNDNKDSIVNDCFAELVRMSTEMHELTEGCFDCTVGKLVNAWGFGFSKRQEMSDSTIEALLHHVGRQPIVVTDDKGNKIVHKPSAETTIDFNAIAQGYTTDLVSHFLESHGIENYLVDIGGEIYARGCKKDGTPWNVGIERPAENKYSERQIETVIGLKDLSVVTSGNYRKYYEKDGVRYSHKIDPTTGRPVDHTLLSVSVVDTAAWRADALATAFMVMGMDRALNFIERHPDDTGMKAVLFIYNDEEGYKSYATEGWKRMKIDN